MTAEREFSDELEDWLRADTPKTIGDLGDAFQEKSFAVTILLLMFLPALPLPTGGITHVFEVITIFVALQMVLGRRTIWLPRRWKQRELGATITGKAVPFIIRRARPTPGGFRSRRRSSTLGRVPQSSYLNETFTFAR